MTRSYLGCLIIASLFLGACGSHDTPTTPPPPPAEPVRVGGNVTEPVKTKNVQPAYPAEARQKRIQGIVILDVVVDATGHVGDIRVLQSPDPLLSDASIEAVRQWEYRPALLNGEPIAVLMTVTIDFSLQ
jgi:protein TonB